MPIQRQSTEPAQSILHLSRTPLSRKHGIKAKTYKDPHFLSVEGQVELEKKREKKKKRREKGLGCALLWFRSQSVCLSVCKFFLFQIFDLLKGVAFVDSEKCEGKSFTSHDG